MQTTINQSVARSNQAGSKSETPVLLVLLGLGIAGLLFLFSRTNARDFQMRSSPIQSAAYIGKVRSDAVAKLP